MHSTSNSGDQLTEMTWKAARRRSTGGADDGRSPSHQRRHLSFRSSTPKSSRAPSLAHLPSHPEDGLQTEEETREDETKKSADGGSKQSASSRSLRRLFRSSSEAALGLIYVSDGDYDESDDELSGPTSYAACRRQHLRRKRTAYVVV